MMILGWELIPDLAYWQNAAIGVAAERAGFNTLWVTDHYYNRDPSLLLATLARFTHKVHLGPGVHTPFLRHPAILAATATSLNELTGGRALLGLGAGDQTALAQLGIPQTAVPSMIRDAIGTIRSLWTTPHVTMEGTRFPLHNAGARILPAHSIPIYLAAQGDQMLRLAGELADGVLVNATSLHALRGALVQLTKGTNNRRGLMPLVKIASILVSMDTNRQDAVERARKLAALIIAGSSSTTLIELGLHADQVTPVRDALARGDLLLAGQLVTDSMVHAVALAGTPEDVLNGILAIQRLGYEGITVATPNGVTKMQTLRSFQTAILPVLLSRRE